MMKNSQQTKSDGALRDPVAKDFFDRLAAVLNEYADRRHLAVRRYQQNCPIWMFHFLHPKGGFGAVQLTYDRRIDEVQGRPFVCAHWHDDNEDSLVRHAHETTTLEFMAHDVDANTVIAVLEQQLATVLAWDRAGLTRTSPITGRASRDENGNLTSDLERRFQLPVVD